MENEKKVQETKKPVFRLDVSKIRSKEIVVGESSSTSYSGCSTEG